MTFHLWTKKAFNTHFTFSQFEKLPANADGGQQQKKKNMKNNNVSVSVLSNGNSIQEFEKDSRVFIEGRENWEYSVKLENHNSFRVKVTLGIDGVNVIDSKPIGEDSKEMGYILGAGESTVIKGYRLDESNVASFRFTDGKSAYANTVKGMGGKTQGVIACRVYREKDNNLEKIQKIMEEFERKNKEKPAKEYIPYPVYPSWPKYPWYQQDDWGYWRSNTIPYTLICKSTDCVTLNGGLTSATNLNSVSQTSINCMTQVEEGHHGSPCADFSTVSPVEDNPFKLGSTFGSKIEQKVVETAFETGEFLCELVIYYATRIGLESLGIEFKKVAKISAFPEHKPGKYCAVPSGWVG